MNKHHFDQIRPFVETMEHTLNNKVFNEPLNYFLFCNSARMPLLIDKFLKDTTFNPISINCAQFTPYIEKDIDQSCAQLKDYINQEIATVHNPVIVLNNFSAMFLEQIENVLQMLQSGFQKENQTIPVVAISLHIMRTSWKETFNHSVSLNADYLNTSISLENLERQKTYERLAGYDAENSKKHNNKTII
jgi:hypothetical protein